VDFSNLVHVRDLIRAKRSLGSVIIPLFDPSTARQCFFSVSKPDSFEVFQAPTLVVAARGPESQTAAGAIADSLGTSVIEPTDSMDTSHWCLWVDGESELSLQRPDGVHWCVDFTNQKIQRRAQEHNRASQPIIKALGLQKIKSSDYANWKILDGTAGAGTDAWMLASVGASVTMVEQNAVLHTLLQAGIRAALNDPSTQGTASRLSLVHDSIETVLSTPSSFVDTEINAIYLDPMYPDRRSTAAVKKPMQFIQALVGKGPDPINTLRQCLNYLRASNLSRVVVKRPAEASPLLASTDWDGQLVSINAGAVRFDVYLDPS